MASSLLEGIASAKGGIKGGYRGTSGGDSWKPNREQIKLGLAVLGILIAAIVLVWHLTGRTDAGDDTKMATVMDSESGEVMRITLQPGSSPPFVNSKTTRATLYRPELCYWTRDGKVKSTPTYVILNSHLGKPGETLCPDCGRPVKKYNPMPPWELIEAAKKEGR